MSLLRLVTAWLVLAALPMQGMAAATLLFCGQAAHSTSAQQPARDHAAHGHGGASSHDGHHAQGELANAGQSEPDSHGGKASMVIDDHTCPICASCCNLVALYYAPTLGLDAARPAPPPHQGPSRVATREAPTPDKPPRA